MRVLQSYWSRPSQYKLTSTNSRHTGGWPSEKYHTISWALSCLQLKCFYTNVELYTDNDGLDWLINKCHLPYDNVRVELDCLNNFSPLLWALPKIYTYSKQTSPFVHVDGDVYIWKAFSPDFVNSPLFVQNFEIESGTAKALEKIKENFVYVPISLKNLGDLYKVPSVNAGIIGGSETSFFMLFSNEVFKFLKNNEDCYQGIDLGVFNIIYEQILFYHLSIERKIPVSAFATNVGKSYSALLKFNTVPQKTSYIHMIGYAKENSLGFNQMEAHFKYLYPKFYNHICDLYPEQINFLVSESKFSNLNLPLSKKTLDLFFNSLSNTFHNGSIDESNNTDVAFKSLEDQIENVLENNFNDSRSHLLSDIYQLEKGLNSFENLAHSYTDEPNEIDLLYQLSVKEFLNLSFELNKDNSHILHLYFEWSREPSFLEMEKVLNTEIYINKNSQVSSSILFKENGKYRLEKIKGWLNILYILEDNPRTGNQILEEITTAEEFIYRGLDLKNGLYDFLTFQLFAKKAIKVLKEDSNFLLKETETSTGIST